MDLKTWISYYKWPIIGAVLGCLLGILFFTVGFFKTLILLVLTSLGCLVGIYMKNSGYFPE